VRVAARVGCASAGSMHGVSGVDDVDFSSDDNTDNNNSCDNNNSDNDRDDSNEHDDDGSADDGACVLPEPHEPVQSDELGGELRSERAVLLFARGSAGVADAGDCNHVLVVGRPAADTDVRGDGLLVGMRGQSSVGVGAGAEQRGSVGSRNVREQ
jgi:hypothetical protein